MAEKTYIGKSKIQGKGLMAGIDLSREDGFIGVTHENNWPTSDLGQNYNHSDNPNARVSKIGNRHYIVPIDKIAANEEITVDYRKQKELEQPESFAFQNGGSVTNAIGNKNSNIYVQSLGEEMNEDQFNKLPKFVQKNKSFHMNPSNELNVMGTDQKAEPLYNRTFGDRVYDVLHPRRSPRISMKFEDGGGIYGMMKPKKYQNGGGIWVDPGDTLFGQNKASINQEQWDKYKSDYAKIPSAFPMPDDAYITQNVYDEYIKTGSAHTFEAPVKQLPQKPVPTQTKKEPVKRTPAPIPTPTPRPERTQAVIPAPEEKKTPGEIIIPTSKDKWVKNKAGTWHKIQRPGEGRAYNINTGT